MTSHHCILKKWRPGALSRNFHGLLSSWYYYGRTTCRPSRRMLSPSWSTCLGSWASCHYSSEQPTPLILCSTQLHLSSSILLHRISVGLLLCCTLKKVLLRSYWDYSWQHSGPTLCKVWPQLSWVIPVESQYNFLELTAREKSYRDFTGGICLSLSGAKWSMSQGEWAACCGGS